MCCNACFYHATLFISHGQRALVRLLRACVRKCRVIDGDRAIRLLPLPPHPPQHPKGHPQMSTVRQGARLPGSCYTGWRATSTAEHMPRGPTVVDTLEMYSSGYRLLKLRKLRSSGILALELFALHDCQAKKVSPTFRKSQAQCFELPKASLAERCCKMTRVYQDLEGMSLCTSV